LEFSAYVGFIHKESVTMSGHKILKAEVFVHAFFTTALGESEVSI